MGRQGRGMRDVTTDSQVATDAGWLISIGIWINDAGWPIRLEFDQVLGTL